MNFKVLGIIVGAVAAVAILIKAYIVLVMVVAIPLLIIQNMAFTAVSRSRNAGDPEYHFKTALWSNGIWWVIQFMGLLPLLMEPLKEGNFLVLFLAGIIYVIATAIGSTVMMNIKLGKYKFPAKFRWLEKHLVEKDKREVGKR